MISYDPVRCDLWTRLIEAAYDDDLIALHIVAHHAVRAGDARWKEHLALASEEVQHRGLT